MKFIDKFQDLENKNEFNEIIKEKNMSDEINFNFKNIKKGYLIWIVIFILWFIGLYMFTADLRILKKEYHEVVLKFMNKYDKRIVDLETSLSALQHDLQPFQHDLQSHKELTSDSFNKYEKRIANLETSLSTLQHDLSPFQHDLQSHKELILDSFSKYEKRILGLETNLSTLQRDLQPLQQDLQSHSHDKKTEKINLDK